VLVAVAVAAVAGGALDAGGPSRPAALTGTPTGERVRVLRVADGDTIIVRLHGERERVRYIGIDTPESVAPDRPVGCFGERAAEENRRIVGGRTVALEFDAERRDRFGRLLAYVRRIPDGLFVNAALVRGGFARTLTIRPNVRHEQQLRALAGDARAAGRGLWGACRT
jgi:micrococcal nuclease